MNLGDRDLHDEENSARLTAAVEEILEDEIWEAGVDEKVSCFLFLRSCSLDRLSREASMGASSSSFYTHLYPAKQHKLTIYLPGTTIPTSKTSLDVAFQKRKRREKGC